MVKTRFDLENSNMAWCPGCGHITMHRILKESLEELDMEPKNTVFVSGIGQAAKLPQYTKGHMFNGLHGRSLPAAMAIKASNPSLNVIVDSGDGCTYGEGGNHFTHQMMRNSDITVIAHNNMIYGLTKGQASPTSLKGFKTPVQVDGVIVEPFNPLTAAIAQGTSFVARIFVGNLEHSKKIVKQALQHKGFSLIDAFSPCVSFNKFNTFKWYRDNTYIMEDHDPTDQKAAFSRALEIGKYPLGIFYIDENKPVFWEQSVAYKKNKEPLYKREVNKEKLRTLILSKRNL